MNTDTVCYGGAVKALGGGWVSGPLVLFGNPNQVDLEGEFFDATKTDFSIKSFPATSPVYFEHGLDPILGVKSLGDAELTRDQFGIWAKTWLDRSDKYKSFLYQMAEQGRLGWSSGSVQHLARREAVGKSMMYTNWPIAESTLTLMPADPRCIVMPIKSIMETVLNSPLAAIKSVSGSSKLAFAERNMKWDASAADKRVRKWADATDAPNAKYRSAFFWYDEKSPDKFGSYKLQFADVIGGELKAVPRGIFAVAAVLEGSRGGVEIPDSDKSKIRAKVAGYYRRMAKEFDDKDIKVPWATKSLYLGDDIESQMAHSAVWTLNSSLMCLLCDLAFDETLSLETKIEQMQGALKEFSMLIEEAWEGLFGDDEIGEDDEAKEAIKSIRKQFSKQESLMPREATASALSAMKNAVELWRNEVGSALLKATKSSKILSNANAATIKDSHSSVSEAMDSLSEVKSSLEALMEKAGVDYNDLATESEKTDPAMKHLNDAMNEQSARFESLRGKVTRHTNFS